jgi:hypothetical protein
MRPNPWILPVGHEGIGYHASGCVASPRPPSAAVHGRLCLRPSMDISGAASNPSWMPKIKQAKWRLPPGLWFYWWAMKDSNLQPADEEILGRESKFDDFGNFRVSIRVKAGQTGPQNAPLTRRNCCPLLPTLAPCCQALPQGH